MDAVQTSLRGLPAMPAGSRTRMWRTDGGLVAEIPRVSVWKLIPDVGLWLCVAGLGVGVAISLLYKALMGAMPLWAGRAVFVFAPLLMVAGGFFLVWISQDIVRAFQAGRIELTGQQLLAHVRGPGGRERSWPREQVSEVAIGIGRLRSDESSRGKSRVTFYLRLSLADGEVLRLFGGRRDLGLVVLARTLRQELGLPYARDVGRAWLALQCAPRARMNGRADSTSAAPVVSYGTQPPGRLTCEHRPDGLTIQIPPATFVDRRIVELRDGQLRTSGGRERSWPCDRIVGIILTSDSHRVGVALDDARWAEVIDLFSADECRWIAETLARSLGLPVPDKSRIA